MEDNILEVKDLSVEFEIESKKAMALRGVNLSVAPGEMVGIVGESGSGKSVLCFSVLRLLQKNGRVVSGQVILDGENLLQKTEKELVQVRGKKVSMIFQDPFSALNPTATIGHQITWVIMKHERIKKRAAKKRAAELLASVGIRDVEVAMKSYPHQFSGGQRQRIVVAMALSCGPKLLLADEPTTALDVTIQAQVLGLISRLKRERNMAVVLVTHDFGVVARTCSRIVVMYGGIIMEQASAKEIFLSPQNPYTQALIRCIPSLDGSGQSGQIEQIDGDPPDILELGDCCPFYKRCKYTLNICTKKLPPTFKISESHYSACWLLDPSAPEVPGYEKGK